MVRSAEVIKLAQTTRYDLPKLIDAMHITNGVEIGTYCGYFSHYLLEHSRLQELVCVDSWGERYEGYYEEAASLLHQFRRRCVLVKSRSVDAAREYRPTRKFGFVYIDADHRKGIYEDLPAWYARLSRPAIFAGHDYAESKWGRVIRAVNQFAAKIDVPVYVTREVLATWFMILGE